MIRRIRRLMGRVRCHQRGRCAAIVWLQSTGQRGGTGAGMNGRTDRSGCCARRTRRGGRFLAWRRQRLLQQLHVCVVLLGDDALPPQPDAIADVRFAAEAERHDRIADAVNGIQMCQCECEW